MTASIFVSHVYEDRLWIDQVRDWINKGQLGSGLTVTPESEDHRQQGEAAIKDHIRPSIRGASAVLVMVGTDAHNRPWVDSRSRLPRA